MNDDTLPRSIAKSRWIHSIYAAFKRHTIQHSETRLQVSAFLRSEQLEAIAPLPTKNVASDLDIAIVTNTAWLQFHTTSMRIQLVFTTTLFAMSGER